MQPGEIIATEFSLHRQLKAVPTGEIWRALDLKVGRLVTLRFLPPALANLPAVSTRLNEIIIALQKLRHPCIVTPDRLVHDAKSGVFMVSRWIEGPTLPEYVSQWTAAQGTFPFQVLLDIFGPIAQALDVLHNARILHRGFSPNQIILSQQNGIQIIGAGAIGALREELGKTFQNGSPQSVKITQQELGDPCAVRYIAPEQFRGELPEPASDQYSLAMVIGEVLAGGPLFHAATPSDWERLLLSEPPKTLPNIPDSLNAALQKALDKIPTQRFSTCRELIDALSGRIIVAPKKTVAPPAATVVAVPQEIPASSVPTHASSESDARPPFIETFVPPIKQVAASMIFVAENRVLRQIEREEKSRKWFFYFIVFVIVGCLVAGYFFHDAF